MRRDVRTALIALGAVIIACLTLGSLYSSHTATTTATVTAGPAATTAVITSAAVGSTLRSAPPQSIPSSSDDAAALWAAQPISYPSDTALLLRVGEAFSYAPSYGPAWYHALLTAEASGDAHARRLLRTAALRSAPRYRFQLSAASSNVAGGGGDVALPIGLSFDSGTGIIAGTPTRVTDERRYGITATRVVDTATTDDAMIFAFAITVKAAPPPPPALATAAPASPLPVAAPKPCVIPPPAPLPPPAPAMLAPALIAGSDEREVCSSPEEFTAAYAALGARGRTDSTNYVMHFECGKVHRCCRALRTRRRYSPLPLSPPAPSSGPVGSDDGLAPGTLDARRITALSDIVFLVMSSSVNRERTRALLESWAAPIRRYYPRNLWLFSDADDPELGMITLPVISGRNNSDRAGAQHRNLRGAQHLWSTERDSLVQRRKWFMFVDDDTWVNVPRLLDLVNRYDERLPLLIGYVWAYGTHGLEYAHVSGGGGLLFSRAAFTTIVPELYQPETGSVAAGTARGCAYERYGVDNTLSLCARRLGVLLLHSNQFVWEYRGTLVLLQADKLPLWNVGLDVVTAHYLPAQLMKTFTQHVTNNEARMEGGAASKPPAAAGGAGAAGGGGDVWSITNTPKPEL